MVFWLVLKLERLVIMELPYFEGFWFLLEGFF